MGNAIKKFNLGAISFIMYFLVIIAAKAGDALDKEIGKIDALWSCPTSKLIGQDRPLPEVKDFKIPILQKQDGSFKLDFNEFNAFLEPSRLGNTDYFSCLYQFIYKVKYNPGALANNLDYFCKKNSLTRKGCDQRLLIPLANKLSEFEKGWTKNIKYPIWMPSTVFNDYDRNKYLEYFKEDHIYGCDSDILYDSEFYQMYKNRHLKKLSPECKRRLFENVIKDIKQKLEIPIKCKKQPKNEICQQIVQLTKSVLSRLNAVTGDTYNKDVRDQIDIYGVCLDPELLQESKINQFISRLKPAITQSDNCRILQVGEERSVEYSDYSSPTKLSQIYQLKRTKEKEYTVSVNLNIDLHPTLRGKNGKKIKIEMNKRVQKCIKKANNAFIGPNNEKLIINVTSDEKQTSPDVFIMPANFYRGNDEQYTVNFDCATITHEVLHKLGLVDEYKEKWDGFYFDKTSQTWKIANGENKIPVKKFGADCRVVGPQNSIMHDPTLRWENAFGFDLAWPGLISPPYAKKWKIDEKRSLLEPAQFLAITRPGCNKVNSNYYACASRAYLFSMKQLRQKCPPMPNHCNNVGWLKGNPNVK